MFQKTSFQKRSTQSKIKKTHKRLLALQDASLFFKLLQALELFIFSKTELAATIKKTADSIEFHQLRKKIHDAWLADRSLIDQFIANKGTSLSEEEKDILLGWKRAIYGDFICVTYCDDYAVMRQYDCGENTYAVLGLTDDFTTMVPMSPPYPLKTTLLPFKGKIVWNGLCETYGIYFGPNASKTLLDEYKKTLEQNLIKTSL